MKHTNAQQTLNTVLKMKEEERVRVFLKLLSSNPFEPNTVLAHTYNLNIREIEAEAAGAWAHLQPHCRFESALGYPRFCLKNTKPSSSQGNKSRSTHCTHTAVSTHAGLVATHAGSRHGLREAGLGGLWEAGRGSPTIHLHVCTPVRLDATLSRNLIK